MESNPYHAPPAAQPPVPSSVRGRPIGISILAVLFLLGGILLVFGSMALMSVMLRAGSPANSALPIPWILAWMTFLAILALTSGIGLWAGRKWGWWLAAGYLMFRVSSQLLGIVSAYVTPEIFAGTDPEIFKLTTQAIVWILIAAYLFKHNVRAFFGLSESTQVRDAGLLLASFFVITLLMALAWMLLQRLFS